MIQVTNDSEFRQALDGLDATRQRLVAARFVENVLALCVDERIASVTRVAGNGEASADELAAALKTARATTFDCHTRCGSEGDWSEQAGYFVARAATAALTPRRANAQWPSLAGGPEQQDGADFQVDSNGR